MVICAHVNVSIKNSLYTLLLCMGIFGYADVLWAKNDIEVVAHPNVVAIQNSISKNVLRTIFGMRRTTWSDGSTIKVFVLPDDALLHQHFSKQTLNIFPYQLRSAWDRLVYSGMGQSPIKVNSEAEMLIKVAETPGAIGYLWRDYIDDTVNVLQLK